MLTLNNGVHDFHLILFPGDNESNNQGNNTSWFRKTINENYKFEKHIILSTSTLTHLLIPNIVLNQNMQNQTKIKKGTPSSAYQE